ncbi:2'-5' RNA ligase family protein [Glutamicibacter protophormiae]|uniref:2'-5' RNA ligase family protein n=2 Tax=Glutamicibacter protophormiae TaxID=37930 RepID=A0ABS4XLY5_GLUPR|nr:2'-5' RNA ligase family protein [Glutamicibacter protophormiae]MBP2397477.1 hypothetical protein [Glutamicibacter protophormiae]GGL78913.1 hypothetical protein GCM10010038_06150 [Glutamicibacter protophormiae]
MHNLVAAVFVEPVAREQYFLREDWPLHITLLRFDLPETPRMLERCAEQLAEAARPALGARLEIAEHAWFGRQENLLVSLVKPDPALQLLHERLCGVVLENQGRIASVRFTGPGYRPHITHHHGRSRTQGDAVALDQVALVDMAPGGDHAWRRVLHVVRQRSS